MERSGKVLCGRWSKDYRNKCQKKKEEEEGREEGLHFWRGGTWERGLGDLGGHFVCWSSNGTLFKTITSPRSGATSKEKGTDLRKERAILTSLGGSA